MKSLALMFTVLFLATAASGQPTIAAYIDLDANNPASPLLSGGVDVPTSGFFDIVIVLEGVPDGFSGFGFNATAIEDDGFGLFVTDRAIFGPQCYICEDWDGDWLRGFGTCEDGDRFELIRLTYLVIDPLAMKNIVVEVSGLGIGEDDTPVILDCAENFVPVSFTTPGGFIDTDPRIVIPPGGLVINPTHATVPTNESTFTQLKARF